MAFSNSFHSSAKSHSIGSASALADAEAHNERDFFSTRYSAKKTTLIAGELGLAENVKQFINEQFRPHIDAYNEKQRRKDRKITESAFEHFCSNKNLDVAVQAIFQVGDKDFWAHWRTDEHIQRRGKETVRHSYPPEVVEVMDAVYKRQIEAYERIYETHAKEILDKIEWHYNRCQDTLDMFRATPERYEQFKTLAEMKPKARKKELEKLSEDEMDAYDEFQEAYHSARDIEKRQYRERIKGGLMHIKMIQGIGHYDEWSPHAHGISVCWTDGYRNGLQSRVAKATVLNRYALEVIQDRMHEIAEEEIAKHPEIFGDEKLKDKEKGHHVNFSTEELIRNKQRELIEKTDALALQHSRLSGEVGLMEIRRADIDDTIKAAEALAADLQEQNTALASELEEICRIKTVADYDSQLEENQEVLNMLGNTLVQVRRTARAEGVSPAGITRILQAALDAMTGFVRQLEANIAGMKIFEWLRKEFFGNGEGQRRPVAQEQQDHLDNILANAGRRSAETENLKNDVTTELVRDTKE